MATAKPRSRRATSPRVPKMRASADDRGGNNKTSTTSQTSTPSDASVAADAAASAAANASATAASAAANAAASRALRLVDEAMDLLHRELFVSEAIARATGEEPEDEGAVVARVIEALAEGKCISDEDGTQGFSGTKFEDDDALLLGLASTSSFSSSSKSSSSKKLQPRQLDEAFLVALGIAATAATSAPPAESEKEGGEAKGENEKKKESAKDESRSAEEEDPKAQEIVRRLRLLREATLSRASASLPAELRALDAAARAGSAEERRAVVREALVGAAGRESNASPSSSSSSSPQPLERVSPAAFYSASCQVIDDMEERQIVPDAALLARVVLCRDDALALQRRGNGNENEGCEAESGEGRSGTLQSAFANSPEEDADLREAVTAHGTMLHKAGAEFAGMLISQCKTGEERRELVKRVMRRGDVLAWQCGTNDESAIPTLKKARAAPRPGRLFAALYATRDALAVKGDSERAKALERARRDAVEVLEEIAYS